MKQYFLLLLIFVITFNSCSKVEVVDLPITTTSPEALALYKRAHKINSLNFGEGKEIREILDSALALDPNFSMALEMYPTNDPLLSKKYQQKASELSVSITEAERKILKIRESYRNSDMDAALENAKWLTENHSNSYESYIYLGQVQSDRREHDEAIKTLKKAIELNPNSYNAYFLLMGHHIGLGNQSMLPENMRDVSLGIKYGDELIRIRPEEGLSYHFKANCYRQLGEFEKAKPLYEKSIEKRKGRTSEGSSLNVSAHNYMFSGDLKTARDNYNNAIELATDDWSWFIRNYYLTVSYIFDNDYLGAIDNINKVELSVKDREINELTSLQMRSWLYYQKLICYAHNQMEEEAYDVLNKRIALRKKYSQKMNDKNTTRTVQSEKHEETAWVNILFGKYEIARESLLKLKEIQEKINDPTAMHGYFGLSGMTNLMEGNIEKAISEFEKGNNTNIYYNYFKGLALKANGREDEAKSVFLQISRVNFSDWNIAIVRNLAKKQLGKA
tara:strand:+ start:188 stop:1696 length:1509 start_codon:yes stop_codon:yes gene_type:complete